MRVALVLILALAGCKREDPHAAPPIEVTPAAAGDVPAGSLRAKTIEVWMAVLLPAPPTSAQILQVQEGARKPGVEVDPAAPPAGRWVEVKPSIPGDAGFAPGEDRPSVRGVAEADLPKLDAIQAAIVVGAGGPIDDVDAILADLSALVHAAAVAGAGWIMDEQSYIAYTPEAFAEGPMRKPHDVQEQLTIFIHDEGGGGSTLTTGGLARFGLPELRARVDATGDDTWTHALDDAAQLLIDHGGLDTAGVLQGAEIRWSASWVTTDEDTRLIELTPD